MALSQILNKPDNNIREWSNLTVNSVKAKTYSFGGGISSGTSNVYLNTDTGDDANDGLTLGSAVLTLTRALDVALSAADAGSELIINVDGLTNIDLGISDSNLPDFDKELNLNQLGTKFSVIRFKGVLTDELDVPAGNATAATLAQGARFTRYTYSGGLTNPVQYDSVDATSYTSQTDIPSYSGISFGQAGSAQITLARPNDGLETQDWVVGRLGGPDFITQHSLAILSSIPVVFERCKIQSGINIRDTWSNLTGSAIAFYGCRTKTNIAEWLDIGDWYFEGCVINHSASGQSLSTDRSKLSINYSSIFTTIKTESSLNMNYVNGQSASLSFVGGSGTLEHVKLVNQRSDNFKCLELVASNVNCSNIELLHKGSDSVIPCISANNSTLTINNPKITRDGEVDPVAALCIDSFGSLVDIAGSDIVVENTGTNTHRVVDLEASRLFVRGAAGGSRLFQSQDTVVQMDNSHVYIDSIAGASTDSFNATGASANVFYIFNSKLNIPEVPFAFTNNVEPAFRLNGISELCAKEPVGWNNGGTGTLYQLAGDAAVPGSSFPVGLTSTVGGAGDCQIYASNL